MNGKLYKRFADALLAFAPDFPMDTDGIIWFVRTQGLERFFLIANCYDPGISEIMERLIVPGERGVPHGER